VELVSLFPANWFVCTLHTNWIVFIKTGKLSG
jgi:hypothetical protein